MPTISFVVAVIDDDTEQGRDWRVRVEAQLRANGNRVMPAVEIEVADIAIVRGPNTRETARRALEVAAQTERGSLFTVWTDPRSIAVFLAGNADDEMRSTWARRLFGSPRTKIDANALECDVISLSTIALRDGVTSSAGVEFDYGFPRYAGRIPDKERGLPGS